MTIIYKITNSANGKSYIGITAQAMNARWCQHRCRARKGLPGQFYNAIRKYGESAWSISTLHTVDTWEEACHLEAQEIARFGTYGAGGYNSTTGGQGVPGARKGVALSAEHRAKIGAAHTGQKRSTEHRKKISESRTGQKLTELSRRKMIASLTGRTLSDSHREAIRRSLIGREITDEAIALVQSKTRHHFRVIYPDGRVETIHGLNAFCREKGLSQGLASAVANGKARHHKGFVFEKVIGFGC